MDALAHALIEVAAIGAVTVLASLGTVDGGAALAVIGTVAAERVGTAAVAVRRTRPPRGL